jgi:hypothetical protein
MAKNFAEILIKLGFDKKDLDKGVKETNTSIKDMGKEWLKAGAVVTGVGVAIGVAGKQIYEVGKRGAIVTQTADSFEYLSKKLELPPDLLDQLREASRGTVDDMTLMSSTATLLAGTTDELGKAIGNATPELMNIAKAANKLNPSLGTTAHMYESLALGIKRGSIQILDNLGLTVKIGAVQADFAESIGKTVEQLTAEEKQMAILNGVLQEGDKLIQQVGGSTDSATDAFEEMEASITNVKDAWSALVAEAITPYIPAATEAINAVKDDTAANRLYAQALEDGVVTRQQHIDAIRETGRANMTAAETVEWVTKAYEVFYEHLGLTSEQVEGNEKKIIALYNAFGVAGVRAFDLTGGLDGLTGGMNNYQWATEDATEATENQAVAMEGTRSKQEELNLSMKAYNDRLLFNIVSADMTAEAAMTLAEKLGLVDTQTVNAYKATDILTQKYDKNKDGVIDAKEATDEYWAALIRLKGSIDAIPNETVKWLIYKIRIEGSDMRRGGGGIGGGGGPPPGGVQPTQPKYVPPPSIFDDPRFGGQHGLDMIVPPGFPGDRFPVFASSGERVLIQRKDQIGSSMMSGVRGGIRSGYDETALDTMRAMGGLVKSAEKALGISSPSTEMYDIGLDMMEGLEIGIQIGGRGVSRAARDVMEGLDYEVTRGMADFRDEVDRGMEEARSRAARGMDDFRDEVEEGMEGARSRADDGMKDLHEEVDKWLGEISRKLVESGEDWKKYYEIIGMPPNMPWPTFIPPEPPEPSGPGGYPIPDPSVPGYGLPPATMPPDDPNLINPPSKIGTGISGGGNGSGDPVRIGGGGPSNPEVVYYRAGDTVIVQGPAYAAFLVEQQHQAEFEEIGRVI